MLWLAWRRLRARPSWTLLAGGGLALAVATLVTVDAGTEVARDRFVAQSVERIPDEARAVRALAFGVPVGSSESYPTLERAVDGALAGVLPGEPTRIVVFRESTIAGRFVGLLGVDGVAPFVELHSGRLPARCHPERCEVLRLRGQGALPDAPGLRLVQVGTASLLSRELFGEFLAPTDEALADAEIAPGYRDSAGYHRPAPGPLVLAEGVAPLAGAPALDRSFRSYGWVWPLRAGSPRPWEINALASRVDSGRAALAGRPVSFGVTAPVEELRAAERTGTVAGRRMLLVGGEAAALVLAFAALAARAGRRELDAARRRLTWYGARRWQLQALTLAECGAVAVAAAVAGWLLGLTVGALVAALTGSPAGSVLRESALAPSALLLAVVVAVVAALVLAAAVSIPAARSRRGPGLVDLCALAAAGFVVVALLAGAAGEERLAESDSAGLVLLLLPGAIAFVAAVAAARAFGVLIRLLGRRARRGFVTRVAVVSLGRGRGAAGITVGFLVLAFSLALLAVGYRATLERGQADEAAYRVPLDVVVREDLRKLVPVLDVGSEQRFAALGTGVRAVPVLRVTGGAGRAEGITGVTALGVPAAAIPELRGWRDEWAARPLARLSTEIDPAAPVEQGGVSVLGRKEVVLRAGPGLIAIAPTIAGDHGRYETLRALDLSPTAPSTLRFRVPARLRHGRLVALELRPPRIIERGADAGSALGGELDLRGLLLGAWIGEGGVASTASDGGVHLAFKLTPGRVPRLRAPQPTDASPPRVLVTPRLAALAGPDRALVLQLGGAPVTVTVAGVVERFPGTTGDAVVGDLRTLQLAVGTAAPGAARTNEMWLAVPDASSRRAVRKELAAPPFRSLETVFRQDLEDDARRDPLANGVLLALSAAAVVAVALAAIGLVLTMLTDARDGGRELRDLESLGATPRQLRDVVRRRTMVVAVAGLVGGVLGGAVLALLVTRLVTVTARGGVADLPLRTTFEPLVILAGLAAYVVLASALVLLSTRSMFGGRRAISERT